jgi:hypothetical protein
VASDKWQVTSEAPVFQVTCPVPPVTVMTKNGIEFLPNFKHSAVSLFTNNQ